MSVRIATFKKLRAAETYACSALEIQTWAKGMADLRIEFGKQRSFQWDPRVVTRPKIEGDVVASLLIDRQLKPALYFYPIPVAKYSQTAGKAFHQKVLADLRSWLEDQVTQGDNRLAGTELLLVELQGIRFKTHRVRYL